MLEEANKGRIPHLVPVRHGRMLKSPFTFYRGAALDMAVDLAGTPTTGIRVQACGETLALKLVSTSRPTCSVRPSVWT